MIIRFCFLIFQTIFALKIFLSQFQYLWTKNKQNGQSGKTIFVQQGGYLPRSHY